MRTELTNRDLRALHHLKVGANYSFFQLKFRELYIFIAWDFIDMVLKSLNSICYGWIFICLKTNIKYLFVRAQSKDYYLERFIGDARKYIFYSYVFLFLFLFRKSIIYLSVCIISAF